MVSIEILSRLRRRGGPFQNMERALRHLKLIVPVTMGATFFRLFRLFRSLRFAGLSIFLLSFARWVGTK
jgi:cobalt-zinc-cadmium resistance protein CzcA